MDDTLHKEISENDKVFGGKKYNPNALRDVKKKLSFMNKKIGELHQQRKFAYKNSAKVKKMIHNQVNQIVKCFRARERDLWSEVDEVYISQDATISDELSKWHSVYARCKVLFNHLDDFKVNRNILLKIHSLLAEINFEKLDTKPLEFISEFETMKINANNYGHLEGDFLEKDNLSIAVKKDYDSSNAVFTQFLEKEASCNQPMPVSYMDFVDSNSCLDKFSATKEKPEIEDDFQIIDLLDNMCCHDDNEDYIMCEEETQNYDLKAGEEFNAAVACEIQSKLTKIHENAKYSNEVTKSKSFILEEEWRHVAEMNKKIVDFKEMLKSKEENFNSNVYSNKGEQRKGKQNLNNCKKSVLLKDENSWLSNLSLVKELKIENINVEKSVMSPAELIQRAFKPYFSKDNVKNWLSHE